MHAAQVQIFLTHSILKSYRSSLGGRLVKLPVLQEWDFLAFVVPVLQSWDGVDTTLQYYGCSGAFSMPPTATDLDFPSSSQMLSFLPLPVYLSFGQDSLTYTIMCKIASGKVLYSTGSSVLCVDLEGCDVGREGIYV